jgi:hypothetical protein
MSKTRLPHRFSRTVQEMVRGLQRWLTYRPERAYMRGRN